MGGARQSGGLRRICGHYAIAHAHDGHGPLLGEAEGGGDLAQGEIEQQQPPGGGAAQPPVPAAERAEFDLQTAPLLARLDARYGDRMSAVFDLTTRDGRVVPKQALGLSFFNAS